MISERLNLIVKSQESTGGFPLLEGGQDGTHIHHEFFITN
jgi:hypothetical protein